MDNITRFTREVRWAVRAVSIGFVVEARCRNAGAERLFTVQELMVGQHDPWKPLIAMQQMVVEKAHSWATA